MNWVKQKYDILLLAVATLLLVSNAGWIAMNRMEPVQVQAALTVPKENAIFSLNLDAVRQASALADSPAKWKSSSDLPAGTPERGSLLVSRRYLLKDGKLIDPLAEGSDQLHPPITNDWLLANGLDYTDMNIKEKDADGDGFSNLEEFEKKTNPNDPKEAPASLNKLKLVGFKPVPFRLEFKGDPSGEGKEFQINLKDLKGSARSQYRKIGEQIEGAPYKILKYEFKEGPNERGVTMNLSELTVQNTETGDTIILIFNKEANDPTSFGTFRNLLALGDADFTLKKGEEFTIKPDTTRKLKLIDITATKAQIRDISTGDIFSVNATDSSSP
jgi:hypothetical protein